MRLDWEQVRTERGGLAYLLAQFQVTDSWKSLGPFMEARERASVEDVRRVAQRYFVPANRIIATARRAPQPPANDDHRRAVTSRRPGTP